MVKEMFLFHVDMLLTLPEFLFFLLFTVVKIGCNYFFTYGTVQGRRILLFKLCKCSVFFGV